MIKIILFVGLLFSVDVVQALTGNYYYFNYAGNVRTNTDVNGNCDQFAALKTFYDPPPDYVCMGTGGGTHIVSQTGGQINSYQSYSYLTCPDGGVYNPASETCEQPVVCQPPEELADDGNYCTLPTCEFFESPDPVTGVCTVNDCSAGQMRYLDATDDLLGCTDIQECTVIGTHLVGSFEFCAEELAECTESGGIYGSIQDETTGRLEPACGAKLPPPADCASGDAMILLGDEYACLDSQPSQDVCDGSLYDCDADGAVDDQDNNGVLDNGIGNALGAIGSIMLDSGTGTGGINGTGMVLVPDPLGDYQIPPTSVGIGNIGYNPFDVPSTGAGQCDPTATNYLACISKVDNPTGGLLSGGDGEDPGVGECDPTASNYEECIKDKSLQTVGDTPELPAIEFPEKNIELVGAYNAISNSSFLGAFTTALNTLPDSEGCPTQSFTIFDRLYTIDFHCQLAETIRPLLAAIMIAIWSIFGMKRILSA